MDMEEKSKQVFQNGAEKLRFEQEQCLEVVGDKFKEMARKQYEMVFSELVRKCENDAEFDMLVLQEHKSWGRCMKYAAEQAMKTTHPTDKQKELARRGEQPIAVPVDSVTLFQWIDEYYRKDDKEEFDKKEIAKGKKKKTNDNKKKKPEKIKEAVTDSEKNQNKTTSKEEGTKNIITGKSRKKEMEGQLNLFEFM